MPVNDDGWGDLAPIGSGPKKVLPFRPKDAKDAPQMEGPTDAAYEAAIQEDREWVYEYDPSQWIAADAPAVDWPTIYDMFNEESLPPRQWVYGQHYLRQFVSVLASAGGIGKTSLQIVEALAICTGRPLLGEVVHEQTNVWLVNLEDPMEEMQRRVLAAMRLFRIKPEEVRGRLFLDAGRNFRMKFATQTREGVIPNAELIKHMVEKIPERQIGAVFIDPFVGTHDVSENDNGAINSVLAEIRTIADATGCAIGLVHHIRKGNGEDATIDSVRGANSLIGAARAARVINRLNKDEAAKLGIDELEAASIFRVDDGKANLAPPTAKSVWRKMQGVKIANGEWVGVAVEYKLPDAFEGISANQVRAIRSAVIACASPPAENHSNKRWVGLIVADVLGMDTEEPSDKARIMSMLKTWIKTGVLAVDTIRSTRDGRDVKVIIAGDVVPGEVPE
jgi:RecA-family ATPase